MLYVSELLKILIVIVGTQLGEGVHGVCAAALPA
jgi:hypothetical protein